MQLDSRQLEEGFGQILKSPKDQGSVDMIVCRPSVGERQVLDQAQLTVTDGLSGDNWRARGYRKTADGSAHPDMQLTLMNARAIALIAHTKERWPLAGDQFFVDLDLSPENLPPGTRLKLGSAIIEVTAEPHLGCKKFADRFGKDAALFVNSDQGKSINLRGVNAKVIEPGEVATGGAVCKM